MLAERDAGSSSGSWAVVAATLCTIAAPRVRWSLVGALIIGLVVALAVDRRLFDVQHLISAVAVVLTGVVLSGITRRSPADGPKIPSGAPHGRLPDGGRRAPRVRPNRPDGGDRRDHLGHDGGGDLSRDGRDRRAIAGLDGEDDEAAAGPGQDEAVDPRGMARAGTDRVDHDGQFASPPRLHQGRVVGVGADHGDVETATGKLPEYGVTDPVDAAERGDERLVVRHGTSRSSRRPTPRRHLS
jgi:hypothetical protein